MQAIWKRIVSWFVVKRSADVSEPTIADEVEEEEIVATPFIVARSPFAKAIHTHISLKEVGQTSSSQQE